MSFQTIPGRTVAGQLGFPAGCSAAGKALDRCTAEQRGGQCLLCERRGDTPTPFEIDDIGYSIVGRASVQIIRSRSWVNMWLVAVLTGCRMVDPRWPIIACRSRETAIELAHLRAKQIEPRRAIKRMKGEGAWMCGSLYIWEASPSA